MLGVRSVMVSLEWHHCITIRVRVREVFLFPTLTEIPNCNPSSNPAMALVS